MGGISLSSKSLYQGNIDALAQGLRAKRLPREGGLYTGRTGRPQASRAFPMLEL